MVVARRLGWFTAALVGGLVGAGVAAALDGLDTPATVTAVAVRGEQVFIGPETPPPTARYRVTFDVTWGAATHPGTLPPNSHTSPPVVAVHGNPDAMFAVGVVASNGIEVMAEVGSTAGLVAELRAEGSVAAIDTGRRIDGPGTDVFEVDADQTARHISLVSMLAPSPDWFVGIHAVDVYADDRWADRIELPLVAYDAGTDSGELFTSPNADTSPPQPIAGPRDPIFAAAAQTPFGRVVIERIG